MQKRYKKSHSVRVGDIVSLEVDARDRSHASPRQIIGIVYEATKLGSGQLVAEWGLIAGGNQRKVCPISGEKLTVLSENATISIQLEELRKKVLGGSFEEKDYNKISVAKAHRLSLGMRQFPEVDVTAISSQGVEEAVGVFEDQFLAQAVAAAMATMLTQRIKLLMHCVFILQNLHQIAQ